MGGSPVDTFRATYGSSFTAPTPPTKAGHNFVGWFYEEDFQTLETFKSLSL